MDALMGEQFYDTDALSETYLVDLVTLAQQFIWCYFLFSGIQDVSCGLKWPQQIRILPLLLSTMWIVFVKWKVCKERLWILERKAYILHKIFINRCSTYYQGRFWDRKRSHSWPPKVFPFKWWWWLYWRKELHVWCIHCQPGKPIHYILANISQMAESYSVDIARSQLYQLFCKAPEFN